MRKYIINMVNRRGENKIKYLEGIDIKDAQTKAESQYADWEVVRITPEPSQLDYYSLVKDMRKHG